MNRGDRSSEVQVAESTYDKAVKAELAKQYDTAYRNYVHAADLFLHLNRSAQKTAKEEARWNASAEKAIQRAEKIKAFVARNTGAHQTSLTPHATPDSSQRLSLTPVAIDYFSAPQQSYILKKGDNVNGITFLAWDEPGLAESLGALNRQPTLSPEQEAVSTIWKIPAEMGASVDQNSERRILPEEILQHIVTDCSVCASISVCLEHNRRFGTSLAMTSVSTAISSLQNQYDIKVFFNGTWRRYMKLMGGYDFPGSNSSIDLHALTGWIPEHLEIRGSQFERERSWERVIESFQMGLCLITLGTGTAIKSWQGYKFLPSHSYAVVDLRETTETRTITLLDTWVNPDHELQERKVAGRIEMPWFDVLNIFDGIYLSWDPSMLPNQITHHGMWNRAENDDNVRQVNVNFTVDNVTGDREVWVLLTRHVVDSKRTSDYISLKVNVEDDVVHDSLDQNNLASQGTYTNSTHVLVRTSIPTSFSQGVLSIVSSYEGNASEIGFTLTVYAGPSISVAWDETVPAPVYTKKIEGLFSSKTSGGNCTYPTFMLNPQYHLKILASRGSQSSKAKVTFTLQTNRNNPVNISVAWSQGERIYELANKDLTVSSGAYTYGLARLTKDLAAGDYTIIVSAFEPRHMGELKLKVESSQPIELSSIPQEGAGMYLKPMRGAWDSDSAMGGPTSKQYLRNPTFQLSIPIVSQIKIRLQLLRPSTGTALNVTLFPASASETLGRHITTSGAYSDATCGVVTPQVTLSPGKYWVIPSTYNPGVEAGFQLLVYSSAQNVKITEKEATSD